MTISITLILGLDRFLKQIRDIHFPVQTAYKLFLLKKNIEPQINFYKERMNLIISQYSKKDANGNPIYCKETETFSIQTDLIDECTAQINELLNLTVELQDIEFKLSDFSGITMSLELFELISPVIAE